MAKSNETGFFNDLDAFFAAADSADPATIERAASGVEVHPAPSGNAPNARPAADSVSPKTPEAGKPKRAAITEIRKGKPPPSAFSVDSEQPEAAAVDPAAAPSGTKRVKKKRETKTFDPNKLDGKFIALDPETIRKGAARSDDPFVLIPANIHSFLPWWVWATIIAALLVMIGGIMFVPEISLARITARLGGNDNAQVQGAMRQLVLKGDDRTISRLYTIASSDENDMSSRLRAVDTLGLIDDPGAERVLLRLELAANTEARVRAAAIAARKQREAAKAGPGGRQ